VEAWTDERLDDLAATLRPLPAQMARNTEALERITDEMRSMREEMAAVRADLSASQRQIAQIGWAMASAVVGLLIALMIATL
jgi:chromosome segregation ATPase